MNASMNPIPPPGPAAPYLSVVIPAYNEEIRISRTLREIVDYLTNQEYPWEILVADDGSSDATARLVAEAAPRDPRIRLLSLPHRGKGWAVKNGMLAADGQFRLLCDADLSVPIARVERLLPHLAAGADIAVGSREAPGAVRYGEPARRHIMGRVFNLITRRMAVPGLADTQCGFKGYRAAAAQRIFADVTLDGFSFDVEALYLARRHNMTVTEIAIDWHYGEHSKVNPIQDALTMSLDLLRIRWRHRRPIRGNSP